LTHPANIVSHSERWTWNFGLSFALAFGLVLLPISFSFAFSTLAILCYMPRLSTMMAQTILACLMPFPFQLVCSRLTTKAGFLFALHSPQIGLGVRWHGGIRI
jgi:hypothetical protein